MDFTNLFPLLVSFSVCLDLNFNKSFIYNAAYFSTIQSYWNQIRKPWMLQMPHIPNTECLLLAMDAAAGAA